MVVRRQRELPAAPAEVWAVVSDPSRLPAWWPAVSRVEDASAEAWTTVLVSPRGKTVRADYTLIDSEEPVRRRWRHEVAESPFERLLWESTVTMELEPQVDGEGTVVTVTLDQRPRGWARFSPFQLRAAARRQAEGALDGLAALFGDGA